MATTGTPKADGDWAARHARTAPPEAREPTVELPSDDRATDWARRHAEIPREG